MTNKVNNKETKLEKKERKRALRKEEKRKVKEENKRNQKVDKKTAIKRIVLLVLIIIWAVFVFNFSNQTGEESSGLSRKVAELFFHTEEALAIAEPIIRKLAHFAEYALGGFLMYLLVDTYPFSKKKKFIITLLLGIWYAAIDEIHQLFVPARSGTIRDVCIDTLGFTSGILFTKFVLFLGNKIKTKKSKKREENNIQNN